MRRFAFPDRFRLTSRTEFDRVFKDCTRSTDALFTVLARPNDNKHPRLGLVVSRKAAGNAVKRHRLKRLVRESFRLAQHELPDADIVVIARAGVSTQARQKTTISLRNHWGRIRQKCG